MRLRLLMCTVAMPNCDSKAAGLWVVGVAGGLAWPPGPCRRTDDIGLRRTRSWRYKAVFVLAWQGISASIAVAAAKFGNFVSRGNRAFAPAGLYKVSGAIRCMRPELLVLLGITIVKNPSPWNLGLFIAEAFAIPGGAAWAERALYESGSGLFR